MKVLMMAFAKGNESKETVVRRYQGIGVVNLLGVNPTKAELEKLYNTTLDKAPEYIGELTLPSGEKVPQVRIDFLVKTDPEHAMNNGIEMSTKLSFFVARVPDYNKDKTKVRVINKYGEECYLPLESVETKVLPENMQWYCMDGARVAYRGEKDLTSFLKNFLAIPSRTYRDRLTGESKVIDNPQEAEAQLGKIEDYFKGDFSELRDIVASQPNNRVQVCFGVKITDDNKLYQDVFIRTVLRLRVKDYSKLDKEIQEAQAAGAYSHTEFSVEPLHEYQVAPTTFSQEDKGGAPAAPSQSWYN